MKKLFLSQLREVEREFNCFLGGPKRPVRCSNQQFGIYGAEDQYYEDICASSEFFTIDELRSKVRTAKENFLKKM
jgi:hypothetical protein